MVSRETSRPLASSGLSSSERATTVRSALLRREPAGSSGEGQRPQHRRKHRAQQVRFKDLLDGPAEQAEASASPQRPGSASSQATPGRWPPPRPCSLTLPNPRRVSTSTSTAIQTSPALRKHFPDFRLRNRGSADLSERGKGGEAGGEEEVEDEVGSVEPVVGGAEDEEGEGKRVGGPEREGETALNGKPHAQCREKACQDSNSDSSTECQRAGDGPAGKAMAGTPSEGDLSAPIAGPHCAAQGVRNLCPSISKGSPPPSKDNDVDHCPLKQGTCSRLNAPRQDLDSNHLEYPKAESNPTHPNQPLPKDQACSFPRSCLKTPLNPKQPSISHRTEQPRLCAPAADSPKVTQAQNQLVQPPARLAAQPREDANQGSQSGLLLHPDNRLELVAGGQNPQANVTESASAAGNQGAKSGRTTQCEITSLQSRLQNMEDVLHTSQQTIKVLLDVIQDLEKKEAVRDGRQSYHTGQDIANCGTCRDCACIIYSVEHDFRQQEGRFHRVLSSLEAEAGQSTEQPATPSKQDQSPIPRQPTRTEPKKSKRKCFWFL
ncbi:uncharacterized protein [Hemitrygon akajei]|uniref:uncharacterized protein n=1 Tax=Hemitrygon akajei TaxID=2704970 RepID=UPI003BF9DDBC